MIGSHNKRLMCSVQCLLPRCPPPKLMLISITIITTCADKSNIKVTQTLLFGKMVSHEEHNGGPLIEIIFTFIFSFDSKPSIFYCSCCGHNILHLKQISSIQSVKINNHLQHSFVWNKSVTSVSSLRVCVCVGSVEEEWMTRKLLIFRRKIAQLRPRPIFVRVKLFPGRLKFGGMILSWAGLVSASQFRGDSSCLIVVGLGPGSGPLSGEASRPPWGHSNTSTNNTTTATAVAVFSLHTLTTGTEAHELSTSLREVSKQFGQQRFLQLPVGHDP